MFRRSPLPLVVLLAVGLVLPWQNPVQADPDPSRVAVQRLRHDSGSAARLALDARGRLTALGTPAGDEVDNPAVDSSDSIGTAADRHLTRYGAALGLHGAESLVRGRVTRGPSGVDSVRYQQEVDGVPVLGGEVVLGLGRDRELRSLQADLTDQGGVAPATVSVRDAEATALALVRRRSATADPHVTDRGRTILDPSLLHLDLPGGPRSVRRLEVADGAGVRQLVLVDDRTGSVVFSANQVEQLDRVVCDQADVRTGTENPCTSGFARTETGDPSAIADVEQAFTITQEVSDFYQQVGAVDLTALLGVDIGGTPHLASTVRYCDNFDPCPFANAFWNGSQMYYGDGFATADDVVGHEMTHGYIDKRSELFYWGQSGSINESMADVIGEIIDHRNGVDDDSAFALGEDLPGGAVRSMSDPVANGQPDRMTSSLWTVDQPNYSDNGGVHTDSGVGNKTAYLISQGGTFNGQTITGIDGSDTSLTKTAKLYLDVIGRLPSGADYAQLADTLEQSCADLVGVVGSGFTASDCANVHAVTLATELRSLPTVSAPLPDADTSCPVGTTKRVLYDGESGDPLSKMTTYQWTRPTNAGDSNATSGNASWFGVDRPVAGSRGIQTTPVDLPAGQQSYLSFQGWWLLDYEPGKAYDGGLVQVESYDPATNLITTYEPPAADWINGPASTIVSGFGNPRGGSRAFGGDSRGWRLSRLDLSSVAGTQVAPAFVLATDSAVGFIGWYVDDIQIYTCDVPPPAPGPVTNLTNTAVPRTSAVGPVRQQIAWQAPGLNPGSVTGYQVSVDGAVAKSVDASVLTAQLALGTTKPHTVTVRAIGAGDVLSDPVSTKTVPSTLTLTLSRLGSVVTFHGSLKRNGSVFPRQKVWIERRSGTTWVAAGSTTTTSSGAYLLKLTRSTKASYRVRFAGAPGVTGSFSPTVTK